MNIMQNLIKEIEIHIDRANYSLSEIENFDEIPTIIRSKDDYQKINVIDAFIYRFTKIQDLIGDKLFKEFLKSTEDYRDNMSFIEVLDKLEKLEIISSSDEWILYRKLRNSLTHEYSENQKERNEALKKAIEVFKYLKIIVTNIKNFKVLK